MVAVRIHAPLRPELFAALVDRGRLRQRSAFGNGARLSMGIARAAAQDEPEGGSRDEDVERMAHGTLRMNEGSRGQQSDEPKGSLSHHDGRIGPASGGA